LDTAWQAKGSYLLSHRNKNSTRNRAFVERVLDLIKNYDGKIIGISFIKDHKNPVSRASMYTKGLQILAERYDAFLREMNSAGFIIADSRMAHLKPDLNSKTGSALVAALFRHAHIALPPRTKQTAPPKAASSSISIRKRRGRPKRSATSSRISPQLI
jgi:hypothetical protein